MGRWKSTNRIRNDVQTRLEGTHLMCAKRDRPDEPELTKMTSW
jgi:hypothetical protein